MVRGALYQIVALYQFISNLQLSFPDFSTRNFQKFLTGGDKTLMMAKQRHSSSNSGGYDSVSSDTDGRLGIDMRNSRPHCLRTLFGIALCLITIIFISNMFQVDFFSNLFVPDSKRDYYENDNSRKSRAYCEYDDGPIFFNLKTSLGVSYDGGHWYVFRFAFC